MRNRIIALVLIFICLGLLPVYAGPAARIKDIAKVQGVRSNQLSGYGLVVGLNGTGDGTKSLETLQSIANMLKGFGVAISTTQLQPKNVAAVMVTAQLPPFAKPGDTIDIAVSSLGDAKSLQGGMLLQTPMKAGNGAIYAVGQGPLSIGGYSAGGGGNSVQKNFPTVGLVPSGAIVEKEVPMPFVVNGELRLSLSQPDFTTATRISESIGQHFGSIASATDPGTVVINIPSEFQNNVVGFVAALEELPVYPDAIAKIVINERTATIVMGTNVTIDEVAVAQGGLTVKISRDTSVSQPPAFSGGSTAVTNNTTVNAQEKPANLILLPAASSVGDVVSALNAVGATPLDIISILQAIKAAGALHADLQII